MTRAYEIAYLDDAMTSLGAMLDYAVNSCGEDLDLFYARFLGSGVAEAFSRATPKYLGGMSGIELASLVAARPANRCPGKTDSSTSEAQNTGQDGHWHTCPGI